MPPTTTCRRGDAGSGRRIRAITVGKRAVGGHAGAEVVDFLAGDRGFGGGPFGVGVEGVAGVLVDVGPGDAAVVGEMAEDVADARRAGVGCNIVVCCWKGGDEPKVREDGEEGEKLKSVHRGQGTQLLV